MSKELKKPGGMSRSVLKDSNYKRQKRLISFLPFLVGAIHELPENTLTQYGEIVKQIIEILSDRFNVLIPKHVIMPNHIHLIIEIYNDDEKRAIRESPLQGNK